MRVMPLSASVGSVAVAVLLLTGCGGSGGPDGSIVAAGDASSTAFLSELALYRITPGAAKPVRLSPPEARDSGPDWSPDGTRIVFERETRRGRGLYVIAKDGGPARFLARVYAAFAAPDWSPLGDEVVYASLSEGLRAVDVRTGRVRVVSTQADDSPSWSPDAQQLAFGHDGAIWVMRRDGTGRHRLTKSARGLDRHPAWSPDGKTVAFERDDEVWVVDVASGAERRIGPGSDPAWAPDSKQLLVSTLDGLMAMTLDGHAKYVAQGVWAESSWSDAT